MSSDRHTNKSLLRRGKTIEFIFLVFLVLTSLFFRFYNFPNRIVWNADTGRDFLAGYLISHQAQNTLYGHWNSGINFVYPPYYYYFVAALDTVSDTPEFIGGAFIFFHALSVIVIYFIGKKLYSKLSAGCVAFLYAVSPFMISVSLFPQSAYFGLLIFLISLFFFISFVMDAKIKFLLLGVMLLVFASTFFYGALLFLPIYGLIILINSHKSKRSFYMLCLFLIFSAFSFFIFFSPLILNGRLLDLFGLNKYNPIGLRGSIRLQDIQQTALSQLVNIFPNRTTIAVAFYILLSIYFVFRKKSPVFFISFLFIFYYHVILFCLKKDPFPHYLILLAPFYFLVIGSFLQLSLGSKNKRNLLFLIIFFASFFFIGANDLQALTTIGLGENLQTYQKLSILLKQDYPNYSFTMTKNSSPPFWDSRSIWYFFRKENTFSLPAYSGQIELESQKSINICKYSSDEDDNFCAALINQFHWRFLRTITIGEYRKDFKLYSQ